MADQGQPGISDAEILQMLSLNGGLQADSLDAQNAALQDQLERAKMLRNPTAQHYESPIGAALGGIGDMVGAYVGRRDENALRGQMGQNLTVRNQIGQNFLDAVQRQNGPRSGLFGLGSDQQIRNAQFMNESGAGD